MKGAREGLVIAALVALAAWATPIAAAETADLALHVAPEIRFSNATLFAGSLRFDPATLADPGAIDASGIAFPPGVLYVCPREGGTSGSLPPLQGFNVPCRDAVTHENPSMRFGERTGVRFTGDFTIERFPNASLSFFAPGARTGPAWGAVASSDGVVLATSDANVSFVAEGRSARTVVVVGEQSYYYNGTLHRFLFQGEGPVTVRAGALFGGVASSLDVALGEADETAMRGALRPRALLDLEEAIAGADAREPVANVTALLAGVQRVPSLLNGAILGHLDGSVGGGAVAGADVTFLRAPSFAGRLEGEELTGSADVTFTVRALGFAAPGEEPKQAPFALAVALWVLALAVALVFRWRPVAGKLATAGSWLARLVTLLAFLAWDLVVLRTLGASAGAALLARYPRGSVAALLVFEVASFALAALLLALPLRLALARALAKLAPRAAPFAGAASAGALVAFAFLAPYSMLALGILVARL